MYITSDMKFAYAAAAIRGIKLLQHQHDACENTTVRHFGILSYSVTFTEATSLYWLQVFYFLSNTMSLVYIIF